MERYDIQNWPILLDIKYIIIIPNLNKKKLKIQFIEYKFKELF